VSASNDVRDPIDQSLRPGRRRELHLLQPVVGWLGETPRPLDELARPQVEADAVDDDRGRIAESSPIEVADGDVERFELRLVVLVDRAGVGGESARCQRMSGASLKSHHSGDTPDDGFSSAKARFQSRGHVETTGN